MNRLRSMLETVEQLPRAARWALGAAVAVVLFLLWNDLVLRFTDGWNREADRLVIDIKLLHG